MTREEIMQVITNLDLPEDNTFVNSFNEYADAMDVVINDGAETVTRVSEENTRFREDNTRLLNENNLLREQARDMFHLRPDQENKLPEENENKTLNDLFY